MDIESEHFELTIDEKLFRGDCDDWQNNACPHWFASVDNWSLIAEGYKNAADKLVESVIVRTALPDEMLYPVLFLYRHYFELRLKEVISLRNRICIDNTVDEFGHNLDHLWGKVKPVFQGMVKGLKTEQIEAFGNVLKQFQEIDTKNAEGFRYPKTTGKRVTLSGVTAINLRHVRVVVTGAASIIDGVAIYLGEAASTQCVRKSKP